MALPYNTVVCLFAFIVNGEIMIDIKNFLPLNKKEALIRGWDELDFVLVSGDAYVDHPSFGGALIGRILESHGYRVGILAQPDWRQERNIKALGEPRLGFIVSSGNIDSMVNNYTASKMPRRRDEYSPGGHKGMRPDRAVSVYVQMIKNAYPDATVVIAGVEASLRRFAHYDYWSDSVMPSILVETKADMLMYGMTEHQVIELAQGLNKGWPIHKIRNIQGTCYISDEIPKKGDFEIIPGFEEVVEDKKEFAKAFVIENKEQNPFIGKTLLQKHGEKYLVQLPPSKPLTQKEMDEIYSLPFNRTYHPRYEKQGGIPALQEVEFSVTDHRGCFGGCSFCAISFHQGRIIQNRSEESVITEVERMTTSPNFKGYVHDIGGPTANFRNMSCKKQLKVGACKDRQCLFPTICPSLDIDHKDYLDILRKARNVKGVKKVFVRSGVRFDYVMADKNTAFIEELTKHHISGQLKVAPEHVSPNALKYMGKPNREVYDKFTACYNEINNKLDKKQYLVPYFISSHPGSTLEDAIELAEYTRDMGHNPEQVQDFIPTPGSLSTAMYYTELDPYTLKPLYVAKTQQEKSWQRALLQYRDPKNHKLVLEALTEAKRLDLVGFDQEALIRPRVFRSEEKRFNDRKSGKYSKEAEKSYGENKDNNKKDNNKNNNKMNNFSKKTFKKK